MRSTVSQVKESQSARVGEALHYYPVFLDLKERPCLVIGEGPLADEKAALLARAGARLRRARRLEPEQAADCYLIVADVDDPEEARAVRRFGDQHRIFVNVVDRTEHCSFIAPALVDRKNLLIAISTCGKSPALAVRIRQELEGRFGEEYSDLLEALSEIRPAVRERLASFEERKRFYLRLLDQGLLEILKQQGLPALRAALRRQLEALEVTTHA